MTKNRRDKANNSSVIPSDESNYSHKGSKLPPLNKRKDYYSKLVVRMKKLMKIFD